MSARFIALFAILVAPIIAAQLQFLLAEGSGEAQEESVTAKILRWFSALSDRINAQSIQFNRHLLVIATVVFSLLAVFAQDRFPGKRIFDYQIDKKRFPVEAADFLRKNEISGRMFNAYGFGGYLIYTFYPDPHYRVFVDGRSLDLYGDDFIKNSWSEVAHLGPDWKEVIDRYQVTWIMYNVNSSLSTTLLELPDWVLIYAGEVANIFVKNVPVNQALIHRYPDVRPLPKPETDKS